MASSKKPGSSRAKSTAEKPEEQKPDTAKEAQSTPESDETAAADAETVDAAEASGDSPQPDDARDRPETDEPAKEPEPPADDTIIEGVVPGAEPPEDTPAQEASGRDPSVAETTHPVPVPVTHESQPRNNTFLPLVLGGIIAGVIGYAAAEMDILTGGDTTDPTAGIRQDIDAQQERLAALENAEPPQIDVPEVDLSGIESQLAAFEERIEALEARPIMTPPEGMNAEEAEAFVTELSSLQEAVRSQRDEIQDLIANARSVEEATAEAARAASAQAALSKIVSAIDAGQPFAEEVATLQETEVAQVDPALEAVAEDGVSTLSALQADFAAVARDALSTARAESGAEQGVGGFLKRQLGVRSVTPREGSDPDAVLSRAEAAVMNGDLPAALSELDTLPEAARSKMSAWLSAAQARAEARAAADAMAQRLTAD